jgi:hypothetical protein
MLCICHSRNLDSGCVSDLRAPLGITCDSWSYKPETNGQ